MGFLGVMPRLLAAWAVAAGCIVAAAAAVSPQRICSVSLAGDEWLWLLVGAERVVCVSSLADDATSSHVVGKFPKSIARRIGRFEPVLGENPDLVIAAPWNDAQFLKLLERSGVPSLMLENVTTFEQIFAQARQLGARLDRAVAAEAVITRMSNTLSEVDKLAAARRSKPTILALSHAIVAGANTSVDALVRRAGGRNAAAEAGIDGHKKLSLERILELDPDIVLLGLDEVTSREAWLERYPVLGALRAVRTDRVLLLEPRYLSSVTPFLADGALQLARQLDRLQPAP